MGIKKITIGLCTYNRDRYLPEALDSISKQNAEPDIFQVIIVDNNSTDNTAYIAENFIRNNPQIDIQYIFEKNKGLSFARNQCINIAQGEIICFVDDDAILSPSFVDEIISFFESFPNAIGVGGKVIPKYESGIEPIWMSKYLNGFVGKVEYGDATKKYDKSMKYPAGCNMTYKKEVLVKSGGFDNSLTFRSDDKYIFFEVKKISDEIYYVPNAFVYHYIDSHRLLFDNFKKLYLKTGNEEKIRIKINSGIIDFIKKGVEFFVKCIASIFIWFLFLLKGQAIKGKYVFLSQWFTLKGFCMSEVFVR